MKAPKKILVVVDPTATEHPAVERARWLAKKTGASVELFTCEPDRSLGAEIVRKVARSRPDLVVKDTHYHRLIRRSLFSNTDWNLIRACPAPLMLVRTGSRAAVKTIVAAVDPLHAHDKPARLDHGIITAAQELADVANGELHVVHAFDPATAYAISADAMSFPIGAPIDVAGKDLKRRHVAALDALLAGYAISKERVHLGEGDTREVLIASIAELDADIVVMGSVARGAIKRMLLGSTAELILDHLPCDLLIVKLEPTKRRPRTAAKSKHRRSKTGSRSARRR